MAFQEKFYIELYLIWSGCYQISIVFQSPVLKIVVAKGHEKKARNRTLMSYLMMPLLFSILLGFQIKVSHALGLLLLLLLKKDNFILSFLEKRDAFNLLKGNNTLHPAYRTFSLQYWYLYILSFALSHYSSPKFTDIYWCEHFRHSLDLMILHNATLGDVL